MVWCPPLFFVPNDDHHDNGVDDDDDHADDDNGGIFVEGNQLSPHLLPPTPKTTLTAPQCTIG